jgi:hypothetical protein
LLVSVVLICSAPSAAFAQTRGDSGGGYFGAPALAYTRLRGQDVVVVGGRGGWYVTPSFVLGGGLYGTVTEVDAPTEAVANAPGPLDLKYEMFGLELEYHLRPTAPTHVTLAAFLGGAAARYVRDGTNEQHGETDFLLALAPGVGLERSITGWLRVDLLASYRFTGPVEQAGLRERDVRGPAVALAAKIGRF